MKRLPMMLQLILILFCVMIIPTSTMTWYSGTQILGNSEKVIAESTLSGLESNRSLNENALNYIAQDTIRFASSNLFDGLRQYGTYEQLSANYSRVEIAVSLLKELQRIIRSNDGVYSSFFYLDEADYIISSDKGITMLDRYESLDWIDQAMVEKSGIAGVWFPRKMESGEMVISYVLPLNRLSTATKGMVVVNLNETQISRHMDASNKKESSYYLIDARQNTVISHEDKSLLLKSTDELPFLPQLLKEKSNQGYIFHENDGERLLYTWNKSSSFQWVYINVYSMDNLMTQTVVVQRNIIVLTAVIILVGIVLTILIATWISRPLRELVNTIRERSNLGVSGRNELAFLDTAFRRMQDEEDKLNHLIKEHEQDACSLAIHHFLRGDALDRKKKDLLQEMFPEKYYLIATVSLDHYSQYRNNTSPETRSYHRYLFISNIEKELADGMFMKSVYYGEDRMVVVLNFGEAEKEQADSIQKAMRHLSLVAGEVFDHTVTIGVSSVTESSIMIPDKLLEAMELVKQRMIKGNGQIIYWRQEAQSNKKYIYPANSERRIINFLDNRDFQSILLELDVIRNQIEEAEFILYDNILFIYNQIVGVTIKNLNERSINTSAIFASRGNIYSTIASKDTLDELEGYIREFFRDIIKHMDQSSNESNYVEKILSYLDEHFCEDIIFEDMAKKIGISYSYMRKLVYELTGKSLIDYINYKRIQKAKQLLVETSQNVTQIASEVGYNNPQSFNRFFRKYEGVTPSSYKTSKLSS